MTTRHVFVGYDPREHDAWLVCKHTLETYHGKRQDVQAHPLGHRSLRHAGMFSRTWEVDAAGQYHDTIDGKPFSTDFSHSRFIVPHLAKSAGLSGWVMFVDCDFMFLGPVEALFKLAEGSDKALLCVQHHMSVKDGSKKMDGVLQTSYARKMWSSIMMINLDHPSNDKLTVDEVNTRAGSWLHQFGWLLDHEIGELPETWNWIPGHSDEKTAPEAVHYSFGGPYMRGFERVPYAQEWRLFFREVMFIMTCVPVDAAYMDAWICEGLENE